MHASLYGMRWPLPFLRGFGSELSWVQQAVVNARNFFSARACEPREPRLPLKGSRIARAAADGLSASWRPVYAVSD